MSSTYAWFHDAVLGSNDFSQRTYEEFIRDARIIGKSYFDLNSKLSWGPGNIPTYEPGNFFQGSVRFIKNYSGVYFSNGLDASEMTVKWTKAFCERKFVILDEHKEILLIVKNALKSQAKNYEKNSQQVYLNYKVSVGLIAKIVE